MGLDMYLEKHTYVRTYDREKGAFVSPAVDFPGIKQDRVKIVVEEIGYWRKANAIHKWFVDECAKGVDECQDIYVPGEKLEELLGIVKELLKTRDAGQAALDLPPQAGFFFGGTEIDDWYWKDLEHTVGVLEGAIKEAEGSDIYYRASW